LIFIRNLLRNRARSFMTLMGAVTGNVMALFLLRALNRSRAVGFGWIPVHLSSENVFYSFVIASVLSCIALIWPATHNPSHVPGQSVAT
jgi:hypothetical protein